MPNIIENTDPLLFDLDYSNREAGQQAQIDALIEVSSELIHKHCNRIFPSDTYTEEKSDGSGENHLFIKNPPIISLTEITVVGADDLGDDATFDGTYFSYDEKTGEIQWNDNFLLNNVVSDWLGNFPCGFRNILTTYEGGFTDVPAGIKFACADMVLSGFSPEAGFGNIEFEKLGQYFYRLRKDVIDQSLLKQHNILNMYKIRNV